jgi:hypothetical protein
MKRQDRRRQPPEALEPAYFARKEPKATKSRPALDQGWWVGTFKKGRSKKDSGPNLELPEGLSTVWTKSVQLEETMHIEDFVSGKLQFPDSDKAHATQRNRSECAKWVNEMLGRAQNDEELETKITGWTTACTASKKALRDWYQKSKRDVENEINLSLLCNEVSLKFNLMPRIGAVPEIGIGKEYGYYEMLVKINDRESPDFGQTKKYRPSIDWVEDSFTEECLAMVQQIGRDIETVYHPMNSNKPEKGYITMGAPISYVTEDNMEKQISKLRYLPRKTKKNNRGETEILPPAWKGLVQNEQGERVEDVTLPNTWVQTEITEDMQKFLKRLTREGYNGYTFIPEGNNEKHDKEKITTLPAAPDVKYWNNGGRRCLLDSAASGFYYLGYKRLGYLLHSTRDDRTKEADPMGYLELVLRTKLNANDAKGIYWCKLNKKKLRDWDPLSSPKECLLCVFGIRSSDNKTDHAICIVKNWIFDSNFQKALPLTRESLDLCASSSERKTSFTNVTRGLLVKAHTNT